MSSLSTPPVSTNLLFQVNTRHWIYKPIITETMIPRTYGLSSAAPADTDLCNMAPN